MSTIASKTKPKQPEKSPPIQRKTVDHEPDRNRKTTVTTAIARIGTAHTKENQKIPHHSSKDAKVMNNIRARGTRPANARDFSISFKAFFIVVDPYLIPNDTLQDKCATTSPNSCDSKRHIVLLGQSKAST